MAMPAPARCGWARRSSIWRPGFIPAIGILMALHERHNSGRGQYLDMTLHDCGMALLHPQAANFFLNGKRPMPIGNPHPNIAPYEKYQTRTCEIFIAIGNDAQFRKLCETIGRAELGADPRFLNNSERVKHRTALIQELAATFAEQDGHALTQSLLDLGLPAGPVLAVDEAMAAEHTAARAMVTELDGYRGLGTPIKLSRTPGGARRPPPRFGEHAARKYYAHTATRCRHRRDAADRRGARESGGSAEDGPAIVGLRPSTQGSFNNIGLCAMIHSGILARRMPA